MKNNNLNQIVDVFGNVEEDNFIVEVSGDDENGFRMYVDGEFMWFCETRQDVYDQIEHAKDNDFFDENTIINFWGDLMFESEIEIVQDLINGYGREITLGELLDSLKEHEEFI